MIIKQSEVWNKLQTLWRLICLYSGCSLSCAVCQTEKWYAVKAEFNIELLDCTGILEAAGECTDVERS